MSESNGLIFTWVDTGAYTPPGGHAIEFSWAGMVTQEIRPTPFVGTLFGMPGLPRTERLYPPGLSGAVWGVPTALNLNRYVHAQGTKFGAFGTALVQLRSIHAPSLGVKTLFGTAKAYNKTTEIHAPSLGIKTVFGAGLHVDNHKFTIDGLVHTRFGTALVKNYKSIAYAAGKVETKFGTAWVSNGKRFVVARGTKFGTFGAPTATHNRITPVGAKFTVFGLAKIQELTQTVYAEPITDRLFGNRTVVMNLNRSVSAAGFVASVFGATTAMPVRLRPSGFVATVWPTGYPHVCGTRVVVPSLGNTARFGTSFVSHNPRYVSPPSLGDTSAFGDPPYGVMHTFLQQIEPAGLRAEAWGREDWDYRQGDYLWQIDYLRPVGASHSRFGTAEVLR